MSSPIKTFFQARYAVVDSDMWLLERRVESIGAAKIPYQIWTLFQTYCTYSHRYIISRRNLIT